MSDQKELIRDREKREAERRDAERRDVERRDAERHDADQRAAERNQAERRSAEAAGERPLPDTREERRPAPAESGGEHLLGAETANFRQEWESVQAAFVDEPRRAVEKADALVGRAAQRLTEVFSHERQRLEEQWSRGGGVSTEDLRLALRRYRAFFERLLSI